MLICDCHDILELFERTCEYTAMRDFINIAIPDSIRGILLDFDNTCYRYTPCHTAGLDAVQKALEVHTGTLPDFHERYSVAQHTVKTRIPTQAAAHSRILYFHELLTSLKQPGMQKALELESVYWAEFIAQMQPTPGLFSFLEDMLTRNVPVIILTDLTTRIQFEKIAALGIDALVYDVVTSEMAGVEKPAREIFMLGIEKLGTTPDTTLMIGDDARKDIEGASALGMSTLHIIHETSA